MKINAHRMHYIDEGQGPTLLFVHGTPTWSFLYRNYIKALSKNFRCIAIDHIGFGLSDKPDYGYSKPEKLKDNLVRFIQNLDLQDITLVVHDFGGPIGLGAAMDIPDRIQKIVTHNTWLWETKTNPEALKINKILHSWMGKFLYLRMNFSAKVLLKQGFHDKSHLTKDIHKQYISPFPDKHSRQSPLTIGHALVGSSDWYQSLWNKLHLLENKEWLILWGMQDKFITPEYLDKWKSRLPEAKVVEMDCGHFVQEEKFTESILEIEEFVSVKEMTGSVF